MEKIKAKAGMKEGLYFIKADLPKREKNYLTDSLKNFLAVARLGLLPKHGFYLMIENSIYCRDRSIRVDLGKWLETQQPLNITFSELDSFEVSKKRGSVIYMTTSGPDEDKIFEFHDRLLEAIKPSNEWEKSLLLPYIPLMEGVVSGRVESIIDLLEDELSPIEVTISEITVKGMGQNGWENVGQFQLGN